MLDDLGIANSKGENKEFERGTGQRLSTIAEKPLKPKSLVSEIVVYFSESSKLHPVLVNLVPRYFFFLAQIFEEHEAEKQLGDAWRVLDACRA